MAVPALSHGGFRPSLRKPKISQPRKWIACDHSRTTNHDDVSSAMAHDRTIPDRSESATWLASQLARGFTRALQARAAKLGFSPGQFPILIELWEEEGLTQRQLLDRVDVEQATIANTLSRMERDGLIERRVHPTDKRAQQIFLTDKARDMREEALAAAEEAEQAVFRGFRRFEKELLKEYIRWAIANARKL